MLGTGFTAARKTIVFPLEIPPKIPPELFVPNTGSQFSECRLSLSSLPVISAAANPAPNSIPFTAPIDITAFASSASNFSNTGSPNPAGTPSARHSTIPPHESPCCAISAIFLSISSAASLSGARIAFCSTHARSIFEQRIPAAFTVYARTEIPASSKIIAATAPAATRAAVSLPEERPPPR